MDRAGRGRDGRRCPHLARLVEVRQVIGGRALHRGSRVHDPTAVAARPAVVVVVSQRWRDVTLPVAVPLPVAVALAVAVTIPAVAAVTAAGVGVAIQGRWSALR